MTTIKQLLDKVKSTKQNIGRVGNDIGRGVSRSDLNIYSRGIIIDIIVYP